MDKATARGRRWSPSTALLVLLAAAVALQRPAAAQAPKWTIMVYMLADNNLECYGILDLLVSFNCNSRHCHCRAAHHHHLACKCPALLGHYSPRICDLLAKCRPCIRAAAWIEACSVCVRSSLATSSLARVAWRARGS